MTVLFMDQGGFSDPTRLGKWDRQATLHTRYTSRWGSGFPSVCSIRGANVDARWGFDLDTPLNEVFVSVAMRWTTGYGSATTYGQVQFRRADGTGIVSHRSWEGVFKALYGEAGHVQLIDPPFFLNDDTWYVIGIRVNVTQGRVDYWIDGEFIGTAFDDFGVDPIAEIAFSGANASNNRSDRGTALEDIVITDGVLLKNARVYPLRANAAGAAADWTPVGGVDNYARVNSNLIDVAEYVGTDLVGDRDLYGVGDIAADPNRPRVFAVQSNLAGSKTTADPESVSHTVRIGATNYDSAAQELPAALDVIDHIWQVDPATAAEWELADVNAAEFGFVSA